MRRLTFAQLCVITAIVIIILSAVNDAAASQAPALQRVALRVRAVALTFDDGPVPDSSLPVLRVLESLRAPATFFVIGQEAARHPDLLKEMARKGFEVENHGYYHVRLTRLPREEMRAVIATGAETVYRSTGRSPLFLRPPFGRVNQVVKQVAEELGEQLVLWNIDSRDWSDPGVSRIVHNVIDQAVPGSIILMHDAPESTQTAAALKQIIPALRERGFQFVTVSQLIDLGLRERRSAALPTRWGWTLLAMLR